jgi:hypothetical protein
VTAEHFTGTSEVSRDLFAAASNYLGRNTINVPGKLAGARPGTSMTSKLARKHLKGIYMPFRLPTIVGSPPNIDIIMTKKLSAFVGQAVFDLVEEYNGISLFTFKRFKLEVHTDLKTDFRMDPDDAYELLERYTEPFNINPKTFTLTNTSQ